MGRQIQICTTEIDNNRLEQFLKDSFSCAFFQSSAPSAAELMIDSFSATSYPFSSQVYIWNKAFEWTPEHSQANTEDRRYYLRNTSNAPLIEFSKTIPGHNEHGRIYWAKFFTAGPILYDISEFERFYNDVTRWVIKNAKGKVKYAGANIYYLEDAWALQNK